MLLGKGRDREWSCLLSTWQPCKHGARHLGKSVKPKQTNAADFPPTKEMASERPHFTEKERIDFLREAAAGESVRDIAHAHGCSSSGVEAVLQKFEKHGTVQDLPKAGRSHRIPEAIVDKMLRSLLRGTIDGLADLKEWLRVRHNISASRSTIWRCVQEHGFHAYVKQKKPGLSADQKFTRFLQAREWLTRSEASWRHVVFSDETTLVSYAVGHKHYVYLPKNSPFDGRRMQPTQPFGGKSLHLWAAICPEGVLAWKIYEGHLTGHRYRTEILDHVMLPHAEAFFGDAEWVYQQDGASWHTAGEVEEWFVTMGVATLPWPAHSPDLNPIENFWSAVDEDLATGGPPEDQEALRARVGDILTHFPERHPGYFTNLYASMHARLEAVVASGGLPTAY